MNIVDKFIELSGLPESAFDADVVTSTKAYLEEAVGVVMGRPLDFQHQIIGALVAKLGGRVSLTIADLANVQGVMIDNSDANSITCESTLKPDHLFIS